MSQLYKWKILSYIEDEVGSRLDQETLIGSVPLTNNYVYDAANRLTSVNSVAYTWDNNGNLLNDGVNTYTYDSANRLISVSNQSTVSSYQYSGLGDRLSQTVNAQQTNYTLDLNAGLTQVLNDGTNQYLYGVGRISQVNTATLITDYFMTDALGSVRQLTDAQGEITLANAYEPYGVLAQSAGSAQTSYGFTGEFTDPSGMVYLRARYYMPNDGRFLTRDTWMGDYNSPLSLNRWMYVEGNPINYTDPSGLCGNPGEPPCPPSGQQNGAAPDWWNNESQVYIQGLGYFDAGHVGRGWISAKWFIEQVEAALAKAHNYRRSRLGRPITIPLARAKSDERYWVDYAVSPNIREEQKYGIAYGMYMDFERGYEEYQDSLWPKRSLSELSLLVECQDLLQPICHLIILVFGHI